jgi:hypothetical protein
VLADAHVVPDLAEVVNFAAVVNEGDSDHRAVNAGTGTEFYVIANPHRA